LEVNRSSAPEESSMGIADELTQLLLGSGNYKSPDKYATPQKKQQQRKSTTSEAGEEGLPQMMQYSPEASPNNDKAAMEQPIRVLGNSMEKRSWNMLQYLNGKLNGDEESTFASLIKSRNRKTIVASFYQTLVLASRNFLKVRQDAALFPKKKKTTSGARKPKRKMQGKKLNSKKRHYSSDEDDDNDDTEDDDKTSASDNDQAVAEPSAGEIYVKKGLKFDSAFAAEKPTAANDDTDATVADDVVELAGDKPGAEDEIPAGNPVANELIEPVH